MNPMDPQPRPCLLCNKHPAVVFRPFTKPYFCGPSCAITHAMIDVITMAWCSGCGGWVSLDPNGKCRDGCDDEARR
jgi:hypothetical protein